MWANPRHPSQLYAAFLEGVVLTIYMQVRFWRSGPKLPAGQLAAGVFSSFMRSCASSAKFFREPGRFADPRSEPWHAFTP